MSDEALKHFVLHGVLVGLGLMTYIAMSARHHDGKSTSELATTSKQNYYVFAIGMTIVGVLMSIGVYGYLRVNTSVPSLFFFLFTIAIVSQIVTGWIPFTTGWKYLWHHITSWVMAFSMLPLGALLLVNSFENQGNDRTNIGTVASSVGAFVVIIMVVMLMWVMMEGRKNKEKLRLQQVYIACFMLLLLLRTYT